jgi:kumamolisin
MGEGHVVLAGSSRSRKRDAERVGDADPTSRMEVTLTLRGPQLPALDASGPAISRDAFEGRYGASPDDIARVQATLERFGLTVGDASGVGRSMRMSGTVAQMEEAFHAGLGLYRSADQGEFRGREKDVQIPVELEGIVTGVFGLDERRVARRGYGDLAGAQLEAPPHAALGPGDLELHYSFPAGSGEGQQVGIAEFGGAYFPQDLSAFCDRHGLAKPEVRIVDAGVKPLTPAEIQRLPQEQREEALGESVEVMMDIEIVAGLAPGAEIYVYFATFDEKGWIDLLSKVIVGDPAAPSVLSVSWGLAEDSPDWSQAAIREIDTRLQAAAHMGITICVASGDDGSGDQVADGRAHVNFPASSPSVLSIGGTMLENDQEVVWWQKPGQRKDGGGSTGGGVSTIFNRPSWQTVKIASLNPQSIDGRIVPDITALAGPPFYDLVVLGETQSNGGTSAATPLWAALIARILAQGKPAQGPTFLAPLFYQNGAGGLARGQTACKDITKGDNASQPQPGTGYNATPGYDAASGWGAPNGQQLLASLS